MGHEAMLQRKKEQEQASLLDKQMQFLNKQRSLQQETRDLDMLRAMTMQGQSQFNWATMTGNQMVA